MASAGSIRWRREEFGWITLDYSSSKLLLLRKEKKDILEEDLSAPVAITWEVTYKCNLFCRYCLNEDKGQELSTDEAKRFIEELSSLKVFQINIGGGEPFLRGDILELLSLIGEKGMVPCVSTNGTLLNKDLVKELSSIKPLFLQISLDGATEETNNILRGGDFKKIMDSLKLLQKVKARFFINTVITRKNIEEIPKLYELAKSVGAELRISRMRPSGNAKKTWKDLNPLPLQWDFLKNWLKKHPDVLTGDSLFFMDIGGIKGCGAGRLTFCISPSGEVYPCAFLQEVYLGNVKEESLFSIWRKAKEFARKEIIREKCRGCKFYDSCHGGCPAFSLFYKGSLRCEDVDACNFYKSCNLS